jgi:hypothetical protein
MNVETLDVDGRVVTLSNAAPVAGAQFNSLNRCDLTLSLKNNIHGSYVTNRGCIEREGTTTVPVAFWDKSGATTTVSCAIEAQTRDVNPATLESCETSRFSSDRSCGCGVAFRRCEYSDATVNVQQRRIDAVNQEPLMITDSVVRRGEDYFNILTTRRSFLNSTLSEFYRQKQGTAVWAVTPQAEMGSLPNIDFTADPTTWVEYTRDANNAGVLTTPEYLYRFPTYRSRVTTRATARTTSPSAAAAPTATRPSSRPARTGAATVSATPRTSTRCCSPGTTPSATTARSRGTRPATATATTT